MFLPVVTHQVPTVSQLCFAPVWQQVPARVCSEVIPLHRRGTGSHPERDSVLTGLLALPQYCLHVVTASASRTETLYELLFSVEYLSYPEVCKNTIQLGSHWLLTGGVCFIYITDSLHFLDITESFSFSSFFLSAIVEQEMKKDWLFAPHYRYYVREMRIHAYSQLLESYRSLTLGYMAEAFGVSVEFIDQ